MENSNESFRPDDYASDHTELEQRFHREGIGYYGSSSEKIVFVKVSSKKLIQSQKKNTKKYSYETKTA